MFCSGRILAVSYPTKPLSCTCRSPHSFSGAGFRHGRPKPPPAYFSAKWRLMASEPDSSSSSFAASVDSDSPDINNASSSAAAAAA
ncbi:hypothetical protein CRG98_040136, partial [Punica granatum]